MALRYAFWPGPVPMEPARLIGRVQALPSSLVIGWRSSGMATKF
jgi:hypothetical protein